MYRLISLAAGLFVVLATVGNGQDAPKPLTAEAVKELQAKFRAERADAESSGLTKKFSPEWFARADAFAKKGDDSLNANRLLEARDSFQKARLQLPGLPPDLPADVARIFGDSKLRHTHWVQCLAYSPDGKKLASGSQDGTVKVWDVETGRELRCYTAHGDSVRAVAFTSDGKMIASAGGDKEIRLWDPNTPKDIRTLAGHTEYITSLAFSPDDKQLVSGGADRKVRIHDVNGPVKYTMDGHMGLIQSVAWSPDGKWVASAGADRS